VSIIHRRPADPIRRSRRASLVLAIGLLAGLAPVATPAGVAAVAPPNAAAGGLQPSIQYDEAQAHANDRIAFTPGDRVTVPFRPRRGDSWRIDGSAPRALPAGRLSGRAIRQAALDKPTKPGVTPIPTPGVTPGPTPAEQPEATAEPTPTGATATPSPVIDEPVVDPSDAVPADPARWSATDGDTTLDPTAVVSAGGLKREIFGFLPYWELSDSDTTLDWEKLSTVAYFGVGATANGTLLKRNSDGSITVGWSGWTSSKMTSVINDAHTHHTRVVLTVQSFAWSAGQLARQKALLGSSTARLTLARQIAATIHDRGADGVNLDFEPIASGYADEFTTLVRSIRAELNKVAAGYQLTFDATGYIGNYPLEAATASGGADAVFIMGYDYRSSGSTPVGSIAPIGGPLYDVGDTVRAYTARISASKVILGVPYYGRAWSTATSDLDARNTSGTKYGTSVTVLYGTARDLAAQNGRHYDPVEGVAWSVYRRENCTTTYGCVTAWREVYYDDAVSLKSKYDLVNRYSLRGAGIWALGYDGVRTELYQAIKDKFITDTIPPKITGYTISSPFISPNADGRQDTVRATLAVTGLIKWGYVVEPMTGTTAGSAIRTGTTMSLPVLFTWNGRRQDGGAVPDGTYRITLWTADASDNRAQHQFLVTMDTVGATVGSSARPSAISPNGDGVWDLMSLHWTATERVTGSSRILDPSGATVRAWTVVPGTAGGATWNGGDSHGNLVRDGHYRYRVDGFDRAGNRTIRDIAVNVDRTIASMAWSDRSFDPRASQRSQLSFKLIRSATVTVAIFHGSTLVRRIWTGKALAAGTYRWTWNGRSAAGTYVASGSYHAVIFATSWIATTRNSRYLTVEAH
jgi:spore germination protein YaaH/flagellar hook assembly protein FlgD